MGQQRKPKKGVHVKCLGSGTRVEVVDTIRYMYRDDPRKNYDLVPGEVGIVEEIDDDGDVIVDWDNFGCKWLLNRDIGKVMTIQEAPTTHEVSFNFNPPATGVLGMAMMSNGVVSELNEGPAREIGVQLGWQARYIDNKPFRVTRLQRRLAGVKTFDVVFLKSPAVTVKELKTGSGSFPPGYYFYFDVEEFSSMVGSTKWNGSTYSVTQLRDNGCVWSGAVTVWQSGIGGHGRQTREPNREQWKVGDVLHVLEITRPRFKDKRYSPVDDSSGDEGKRPSKEKRHTLKTEPAEGDTNPPSLEHEATSATSPSTLGNMAAESARIEVATEEKPADEAKSASKPSATALRVGKNELKPKTVSDKYGIEGNVVDDAPRESKAIESGLCCDCTARLSSKRFG